MKRRFLIILAVALVAVAAAAAMTRGVWSPQGAVAQSPGGQAASRPAVPVEVATAVKKPVPVGVDALGTVTPIATVVVKPRLDSEIVGVHFADGALVKEGDLLFTLDSRAIEAQIRQAEGLVARDQAQLDGAERDLARYTELVAKKATPQINVDNAKTQVDTFRAQLKADTAALENLKVQLSYCTIRAKISGKISAASVKVGNFVRASSDTTQLATINQIAPIYVAFGVPQRTLADVRSAVDAGSATIVARVTGDPRPASGRVTMIDNTVDTTTGMVTIRATMDNADQVLWPGALVQAQLTLRVEDAVTVPTTAIQVSQTGSFVFVIKDNAAAVRPVTIDRVVGSESVISKGLEAGEVVVTDGQLLLIGGTKVSARERKPGA